VAQPRRQLAGELASVVLILRLLLSSPADGASRRSPSQTAAPCLVDAAWPPRTSGFFGTGSSDSSCGHTGVTGSGQCEGRRGAAAAIAGTAAGPGACDDDGSNVQSRAISFPPIAHADVSSQTLYGTSELRSLCRWGRSSLLSWSREAGALASRPGTHYL
jgi:hypothetical protein